MNAKEKSTLVSHLSAVIHSAVPKARTVAKYGGTLYTLSADDKAGQFCGVFTYERHVQLVFSQGATLKDPTKLLKGSGKFRRHINFTDVGEVDESALDRLLKAAAKQKN